MIVLLLVIGTRRFYTINPIRMMDLPGRTQNAPAAFPEAIGIEGVAVGVNGTSPMHNNVKTIAYA
jgi:hypothetical protein